MPMIVGGDTRRDDSDTLLQDVFERDLGKSAWRDNQFIW